MADLASKKCVPCEVGTPPLSKDEAERLLLELHEWKLDHDARAIHRAFPFKNFAEAMAFANKVGEIAEQEGHHPDLLVKWGQVIVTLSTHAIKGLSENDFVLAAKIDKLARN